MDASDNKQSRSLATEGSCLTLLYINVPLVLPTCAWCCSHYYFYLRCYRFCHVLSQMLVFLRKVLIVAVKIQSLHHMMCAGFGKPADIAWLPTWSQQEFKRPGQDFRI